jgi:hypothetical protein
MATKKAASLNSSLLVRKGEAASAHMVPPPPASDDLVKLTVKLTPDEHLRLLQLGLRTRPRRSNQEMIREAVLQYLDAAAAEDADHPHDGQSDPDVRAIERRRGERR